MKNNHNDPDPRDHILLLKKAHIIPRKKLGQNFLISSRILKKITNASKLKKGEEVLEIGSGMGALTEKLLEKGAKVTAIEFDNKLINVLRERLGENKNLKIIQRDILEIREYKPKVIGNIPYHITSPLIRKILALENKPKLVVLLVQKEVAERITAKPGSSKRGYLTILARIFSTPEILFYVGKDNFFPKPKVESAVIKLSVKTEKPGFEREKLLRLAKFGFSQKRKKIRNSLAAGLHIKPNRIDYIINATGIDPNCRAEDLSILQWKILAKKLFK